MGHLCFITLKGETGNEGTDPTRMILTAKMLITEISADFSTKRRNINQGDGQTRPTTVDRFLDSRGCDAHFQSVTRFSAAESQLNTQRIHHNHPRQGI